MLLQIATGTSKSARRKNVQSARSKTVESIRSENVESTTRSKQFESPRSKKFESPRSEKVESTRSKKFESTQSAKAESFRNNHIEFDQQTILVAGHGYRLAKELGRGGFFAGQALCCQVYLPRLERHREDG